MKITKKIADDCPNGFDCPRVFETDERRHLVQGYTVTDQATLTSLSLTETETAVWIPASLADQARDAGYRIPVARHAWRRRPGRPWRRRGLIVRGAAVTDPDVLHDLHLPPRESAVIPEPLEALL